MQTFLLQRLNGNPMASAGFLPGGAPSDVWAWIQETVAAECECSAEDVGILESEEDGDLITADGMPVAILKRSAASSRVVAEEGLRVVAEEGLRVVA